MQDPPLLQFSIFLMDLLSIFALPYLPMLGYLVLAIVSVYLIYMRLRPSVKLPPGPRAWPIIGNLNLMGKLPHRSLDRLSKTHGPLMYIRLGSIPCVVASSAEMAREFLQTHDLTFSSRPQVASGKYTTYNYSDITWSPYGEYFRLARKVCLMELFSAKRLESFEYIRVEEVARMLGSVFETCQRGLPVEIRKETYGVSNNIISRMALGRRYFDKEAGNKMRLEEMKEMLEEFFLLNGVFNIVDFIPWLGWLDLQGYVGRMKKLSERLDVFLEEVVEEHDRRRKGVENYVAKDMMDVLLKQADDPQLNLSRIKVKAFTLDIIAGGTETSATLVEWGLSELLKKPEMLERATKELDRVVGRERWVEEKDMGGLEYVQWIVKETMRLHPVAPLLVPHLSTQRCRIAGYDIPANTRVFVNVWSIGRDDQSWENPNEFRPERFKGSTVDVMGRDFELLPFGSGRRMCPGNSLGLKVVQIALANLIHGFQWKLPDGQSPKDLDMGEIFGLSTSKTCPLVAMARPRLPSHLYNFNSSHG